MSTEVIRTRRCEIKFNVIMAKVHGSKCKNLQNVKTWKIFSMKQVTIRLLLDNEKNPLQLQIAWLGFNCQVNFCHIPMNIMKKVQW